MKICWVTDGSEYELITDKNLGYTVEVSNGSQPPSPDIDILIINANFGLNKRTQRLGLKFLQKARRDFRIKSPVIVYSFEAYETLHDKIKILTTKGVSFLRLPFSAEGLISFIQNSLLAPITEGELIEVLRWHCGLQKEWRSISHKIGNRLADYQNNREEVRQLIGNWSDSIKLYAPDQIKNLENLQNLLKNPTAEIEKDLQIALQDLDNGLQNPSALSEIKETEISKIRVQRNAPLYFSKILIADDEDRSQLIFDLRARHYEVLEQARTAERARKLFDSENPEVVLADWHFPEKADGLAFINYVANSKYPPLLLITSKAVLFDWELREAGIPEDVINCSGPFDSSNEATIHRRIWLNANRDNVFEPVEPQINDDDLTFEQFCRDRLERCSAMIKSQLKRWRNFLQIISYTLNQTRLILPIAVADIDDRELVKKVIEILEPHEKTNKFTLQEIVSLVEQIESLHETARRPPESEAKHWLRRLLHGKIEQFSGILGEIENVFERLDELILEMQSLSFHQGTALTIKTALDDCRQSKFTEKHYTQLAEILNAASASLPPVPETYRNNFETDATKQIRIIVAEDDEHWRETVKIAIAKVKARFDGNGFTIKDFYFDNADEAFKAVPKPMKEREITGASSAGKTIVISDICLPEDRRHADKINAALAGKNNELAAPHRANGLKLIKDLRQYAYNVPVVVFSTVDQIEDRLTIGDWGIPDINYISKGVDDYRSVVQALIRLIEKKSKHRLEKIETDDQIQFRIDGVDIKFTKEEKNLFDAFFTICQRKEEARIAGNQKIEPGATVEEILAEMSSLNSKENRAKIEKDFGSVREQILESFRRARRYISTHEIVKTIRRKSGDFAYQIIAEIPILDVEGVIFDSDGNKILNVRENCKILVVENNASNLKQVSELLQKLGHEIETATNVEDAVNLAESFQPDILCLEMNLPLTDDNTAGGVDDAGLIAYEEIRTFLHDVRAIIPTANYKENRLIAKATQLGLSAADFIDKRRTDWLALLAAITVKHQREILYGEVSAVSLDAGLPLIEILVGSDLDAGILKLKVDKKSFETKSARQVENEEDADVVNRILGLLLQNPNEPISETQIETVIGKDATKDMWKNWRRQLRIRIRQWLGINNTKLKKADDPAHKILVFRDSHLTLRVSVIENR